MTAGVPFPRGGDACHGTCRAIASIAPGWCRKWIAPRRTVHERERSDWSAPTARVSCGAWRSVTRARCDRSAAATPGAAACPRSQDKIQALACLAALIATQSPEPAYQRVVGFAFAAGTTEEEMLGVLLHVAPIVGSARVTSAAPHLASALGYDLDRMFDD